MPNNQFHFCPSLFRKTGIRILLPLIFLVPTAVNGQTGTENEPVRYVGGVSIDPHVHEGRLRYAIGVESRQTLRVNRTNPELADDHGWTYNHASSLAYWNGRFYQQYLSNPVDEHIAPGQTLLTSSSDGRKWDKPEVIFPPYQAPEGVEIPDGYQGYMMHQRMGFFVAPNGRLLTLAFYGHAEDPFEEGGIGRVVREIKNDGSFGPIYFIRYNSHTNWNESNTSYDYYKKSMDQGFVEACEALLRDKLITLQWRDEDNGKDGFYEGDRGGSALSYYQRKDGLTVGLWKRSTAALSTDGRIFSKSVKVPTFTMAGGKVWGQATKDGKYAMVYNPIDLDEYRYPLVLVTGEDGIIYDDMLLVQGEVPPRRFFGRWKDFGPCYVRGIVPGNGNPPGNDLWLTYSMNKEDMWVSRVPLPVKYTVSGPILDTFDQLEPAGEVRDWNIYSPSWAPVTLVPSPDKAGLSLELLDEDPYDYARAIRVFEESNSATVELEVMAAETNAGSLELDITDRFGNRPIRLRFDESGRITGNFGIENKEMMPYQKSTWYNVKLVIQAGFFGHYDLFIDGKQMVKEAPFAEAVKSIERLSLRTGPYRDLPNRKTPNEDPEPPLPGADEKVKPSLFYIDDLRISGKTEN